MGLWLETWKAGMDTRMGLIVMRILCAIAASAAKKHGHIPNARAAIVRIYVHMF